MRPLPGPEDFRLGSDRNMRTVQKKQRILGFTFLSTSFLSFLLLVLATASGSDFEIQPYVQAVSQSSAAVLWAPRADALGHVEYGETAAYGSFAEGIARSILKDGKTRPEKGTVSAQLVGLLPDTGYHYRVVLPGADSEDRRFRTAPSAGDAGFRFLVYGDSRSDPEMHARVAAAAGAFKPAFVIHTGDLVSSGHAVASVWTKQFFEPAAPLLRETWLCITPGNHEEGNRMLRVLFEAPGSGTFQDCYSFDWGPVHVTTINTNKEYRPGSDQYRFLEADLAGSSRPFKVFFGHHPTFSSSFHGDTEKMQQYLQPLFEKYGVQLVFAGHDHCYERLIIRGINYVVTGGGGAFLTGEKALVRIPECQVFRKEHHFVGVEVLPARLTLTTYVVEKTGATMIADRAIILPTVNP